MNKSLSLILALVFALGLLGAACGGSDDSSSTTAGDTGNGPPDTAELDEAIKELEENLDYLPENLADCAEISTRWASLNLDTLGGGSSESIEEDSDALKALLPDDLHDDVDVISANMAKVADEGIVAAADDLDSEESSAANDAISDYLAETCAG